MPGGQDDNETPEKFLQGLGVTLAAQEGVDADLAKILVGHIMKDPQKPHSVADAAKAIAALAIARAKAVE